MAMRVWRSVTLPFAYDITPLCLLRATPRVSMLPYDTCCRRPAIRNITRRAIRDMRDSCRCCLFFMPPPRAIPRHYVVYTLMPWLRHSARQRLDIALRFECQFR